MGRLLFVTLVLGTWSIRIANCMVLSKLTQRYNIGHRERLPAPTQGRDVLESGQLPEQQPTKIEEATLTVTLAENPTCGFLSGSPGNAITCENRQPCLWEEEYLAAIGCGVDSNAEIHLACIEREAALNPELCNDVCQGDRFNLLCTDTASPYCRTYVYPGSIHDFRCASTPVPTPQIVSFTHSWQEDRHLSTVLFSNGTVIPSRGNSVTPVTLSATTAPPPGPRDNESPNIGAIVGGMIGGLISLVLVASGIIWLLRRSKLRDKPSTQPSWVNQSRPPERETRGYYEMSADNTPQS